MSGPILIFDKSTLQSLSVDESVWLGAHYLTNVTPLFYVETLADLEKEVGEGRRPEDVVGNLAEKTPVGARANVHHGTLCLAELSGERIDMHQLPVLAGGEDVVGERGERGVVFKEAPENLALFRWAERRFLDVERESARAWRESLSHIDLDETYRAGKEILRQLGRRPADLVEAKAMATEILGKRSSRYALEGLASMFPERFRERIAERLRVADGAPIATFAPYTAHVLTVDLFFRIGIGADLISRVRPSNKIDMAYLYYLPFCMIFTSNDNLHARSVPPFLTAKQVFVRGQDLKEDLAKLDEHYSALPEEVRAEGVLAFAGTPPTTGDFLTSRLWDTFMDLRWRQGADQSKARMSREAEMELIEQLKALAEAPRSADGARVELQDADTVVLQERVPVQKGKWRIIPARAEGKGERES